MNVSTLGWIAGFLLAICSVPQVIKIVREGHANGISLWFLLIWLVGNIGMQTYVIATRGMDYPALISFWLNDIMIFVILKYKLKPRKL